MKVLRCLRVNGGPILKATVFCPACKAGDRPRVRRKGDEKGTGCDLCGGLGVVSVEIQSPEVTNRV